MYQKGGFMDKINIKEKFTLFNTSWDPKIIGELNGQEIKIAKFNGDFVMHNHEEEDELFYVIKGEIKIEFEDKIIKLKEGEMIIVPKGVNHKPSALNEAWVMMFEPKGTINTGGENNELTKSIIEKI